MAKGLRILSQTYMLQGPGLRSTFVPIMATALFSYAAPGHNSKVKVVAIEWDSIGLTV